MTDNEIIKALDCCANCESCDFETTNCPLVEEMECRSLLAQKALDLITRQQREIENLKVENQSLRSAANSLKMHYEEAQTEIERLNKVYQANQQLINALNKSYFLAKSEAYKEFAEKLKKKCYEDFEETDEMLAPYVTEDDIDNLLKEMKGENND